MKPIGPQLLKANKRFPPPDDMTPSQARRIGGATYVEIAHAAGLSYPTVAVALTRKTPSRAELTLHRIAAALGQKIVVVPLDWDMDAKAGKWVEQVQAGIDAVDTPAKD